MKLIKKLLFLPILFSPIITIVSCSSNQTTNNNETSKNDISKNLTKEQILCINQKDVNTYIKKFPELLSNDGVLNLGIFPNLNSINENAFVGITNIKKIVFNEKITEIKDNAFKDINSLIELEIPSTLKTIGENAFYKSFYNNEVIVNFNHNNSINKIGLNAFVGNSLKILVHNETIKNLIIASGINSNNIINGENSIGGFFSNLYVDKYLSIISTLNLDENTTLSSLTNEKLNQDLKKSFPTKSYKITILKGSSESEGVLNLSLKLSNDNQLSIKVIGFNSLNNDKFVISQLKINSGIWFINKQEIENIPTWTLSDWKTYLSILRVSNFDLTKEYDLLKIGNNVSYEIKFFNKKISIKLTTNYKEFDGNSWNSAIQKSFDIIGKGNNGYVLELPTQNDLYDFIKNHLEINESDKNMHIKNKYPSYYLHKAKSTTNDILNNFLKIKESYAEYITKKLNFTKSDRISIRFNEIFPNDIDGSLKFSYNFVNAKNDSVLFIGVYEIKEFKKINLNDINANMKIIKKDKSLFNSYLKAINREIKKESLMTMNDGDIKEIKNFGFLGTGQSSNVNLLYDGNDQNVESKRSKFDWLNKSFELNFNNIVLNEETIDFNTNFLFDGNDSRNGYIVKYLSLNANINKKGRIEKSMNIWTYSFPMNISFGILESKTFGVDSIKEVVLNLDCKMLINTNDINSFSK